MSKTDILCDVCNGTGQIELFTSFVPCECQKKVGIKEEVDGTVRQWPGYAIRKVESNTGPNGSMEEMIGKTIDEYLKGINEAVASGKTYVPNVTKDGTPIIGTTCTLGTSTLGDAPTVTHYINTPGDWQSPSPSVDQTNQPETPGFDDTAFFTNMASTKESWRSV